MVRIKSEIKNKHRGFGLVVWVGGCDLDTGLRIRGQVQWPRWWIDRQRPKDAPCGELFCKKSVYSKRSADVVKRSVRSAR